MPRRTIYRGMGNFLKNFDEKKYAYKVMAQEEYDFSIANTNLVSSRGVLANCDIKPMHPKSSFIDLGYLNSIKQLVEKFDAHINRPITVYVVSDALRHFGAKIAPLINRPFNLVSGDSDLSISPTTFGDVFWQILECEMLETWFAQNRDFQHPKLESLPIGLDYHSLWYDPKMWGGGPLLPAMQESQLRHALKASPPWSNKIPLVWCDFIFSIKHGDRKNCKENLDANCCYFPSERLKRSLSWQTQANYAYVASPSGVGIDCHRTWEALALGLVPIVARSICCDLFDNLPVLVIDSWDEVTPQYLSDQFHKLQDRDHHLPSIQLDYWTHKIRGQNLIKN